MAASSSSSIQKHYVYISVQKDEPSKTIADMICKGLTMRGVPPFTDERQIQNQKSPNSMLIGKELREAMASSAIAIVLFSKDYLCSPWCLEELVAILRCREKLGLIVVPIFFDVDPSDIRKQRGHASELVGKQVEGGLWHCRWKRALEQAGGFCGWIHSVRGVQSKIVGRVVEDIYDKQFPTNLKISIHPLRYDIIDDYLHLFMQIGSSDVLIVGICGPRRMGKTAIAEAVYNQIFYTFEGSSFLKNVGQNTRKPNGLVQLQEKLLSDVLSENVTCCEVASSGVRPSRPVTPMDVELRDVSQGVDMIKEKLGNKRVLVVLDDVDGLDQLYALVGSRSWFGLGSKIIITTRQVHLLNELDVDQVFRAQGLPLPPNIQVIWEEFQKSRRRVAGLKEYIQAFQNLTNQKVKYLEDCLARERRKTAIQAQAMSKLKLLQSGGSASVAPGPY